uniref:Ig-like domain-containing protein n=1 Tax=Cyanoderma ruficeps TaxID=181631 RepID=A0A8C3R704_9PASS
HTTRALLHTALSRTRLYEGSTLMFVAEVVGVPKPGVKWYRNKSLLEPDERVQIEKDGDRYILEITNVQKADEGQYLCHAVNIVGEAKSIAEVEVLPEDGRSLALPPPITHQHVIHFDMEPNTSSRSPSPQEILLECVVTGTPVPLVQWFRGDTCVTPGTGKYAVSQKEGLHSLKVQTVGPSDSGLYRCQAMNRLGEATCKGSLVVVAQQEANAMSTETVTGCDPHRSQKCDLLLSKTVSPGDQKEHHNNKLRYCKFIKIILVVPVFQCHLYFLCSILVSHKNYISTYSIFSFSLVFVIKNSKVCYVLT